MSAKKRGSDQVAVCFFGDGALGQGVLYEVMNMAALWKLPVIYACENNLYGEYTHYSETTAGELIARAQAFGILAEQVDGQDVRAVNSAARRAVVRARAGDGPTFLVLDTYRFHGHHVGDVDRAYYRTKEEEQEWSSTRDPIALLAARLRADGVADETLERIRGEAKEEVDAGVEFALSAPYPDGTEVDKHVFV
jgi:pyruvate dehydrogenase E1 component alpha subunit